MRPKGGKIRSQQQTAAVIASSFLIIEEKELEEEERVVWVAEINSLSCPPLPV